MPMQLRVDEDDYLVPTPGNLTAASLGYMDLIGDSKLLGKRRR